MKALLFLPHSKHGSVSDDLYHTIESLNLYPKELIAAVPVRKVCANKRIKKHFSGNIMKMQFICQNSLKSAFAF